MQIRKLLLYRPVSISIDSTTNDHTTQQQQSHIKQLSNTF